MRTRLEGIQTRLAIYQFAEDAFDSASSNWHRACEIEGRRYVITDDLAYCVRTLLLCQTFLSERTSAAEAELRRALTEQER